MAGGNEREKNTRGKGSVMRNITKGAIALILAIAALAAASPALADTYVTEGRVAYKVYSDHAEVWDYFDPGITGATGATGRLIEYIESNAREYNKRIVDWDYNPSLYSTSSGCAWRVTLDENNGKWYTYCDRNQWQEIAPYTVTEEPNTGTDLVIPARVNGKPVTAMRVLAFGGAIAPSDVPRDRICTATSIDISRTSITSIPRGGFCACGRVLTIKLPNSITSIGEGAFRYVDALTNINVPTSLKTVGKDAFYGCSKSIQAQFASYPEKERKGHWETRTKRVAVPAPAGFTPVYRVRNKNASPDEHHFTTDKNEYETLLRKGWTDEGIAWHAPKSGPIVYRVYNPVAGEHHYTTDLNEVRGLKAAGWKDEGVAWHSGGERRLHREYNPNEFKNNHHYTLDDNEHRTLVANGWRNEDGSACWSGTMPWTTRTERHWVWDE